MPIDEVGLEELMAASQASEADARHGARTSLDALRQLRTERRHLQVDADQVLEFNTGRRRLLGRLTALGGGIVGLGVLGNVVASILAQPAAADQSLDVQILQTASSLERVAIMVYGEALQRPFIKSGYLVVAKFMQTTMLQHQDHLKAVQSQTTALAGAVQDAPNPRYAPMAQAVPTLRTAMEVVTLATTLETVARDTYLSDLAMLTDTQSKKILASVMGVEAQHVATLRTVATLLATGTPQLVAIPVPATSLPAAIGSVGFPDGPFPSPTMASPPREGALP